ncbi:TRAP transporter TAXI family solute receptor [Natronocella acetinitrilica]|uniref:TRAP transporter TAXI family solute receptor n=1 Tax=Natronocella acetinitrilica TaxID=414046 RepID=A0AAE3G1C7_9GAMM|nr:TAXI family TRAP transporter solute-binding subunit [Natronocella acetinitrilica]MCP1673637.1 TRAP transporter TAXI family solute receptor [Natronocella acetinitrilica]
MKSFVLKGALGALALGLGGLSLFATPVVAQQAVPVLLCPQGCGPTESDTILMNQMIRDGYPVVLQPQETPGYMANIRMMADPSMWETTVFSTEDPIIQLAFRGGTDEIEEFLPEPIPIDFRLLYGEAWWGQGKFFVTFDPNIRTVEDMMGKRISLGLRSQSDWGFFSRLFLEHGYGITPDNSRINHMTPPALTQQLIDRNTDVAVSVFGTEPRLEEWLIGGPLRQLEAAGEFHYIGIEPEIVDKVNEKFDTTFLSVAIPAGTLPHQNEELNVAVNRGFKAVHESFSEELAYQIVKGVLEYGPQLQDLHPLWDIWSPELMLHGLSEENTHPGAIRAYKEAGLWHLATETYADYQVTYPEAR